MRSLLTVEQLAEYLCLAPQTIRNRIAQNANLPPRFKYGRQVLFPADTVEKWVDLQVKEQQIAKRMR